MPEWLLWKSPRLCGPFPNNAGAPVPHLSKSHRGALHVAALVSSIGRALSLFISVNVRARPSAMSWHMDVQYGLEGRLDGSWAASIACANAAGRYSCERCAAWYRAKQTPKRNGKRDGGTTLLCQRARSILCMLHRHHHCGSLQAMRDD